MPTNKLEARALHSLPDQLLNHRDHIVPLIRFVTASDLVLQPRPLEWAIHGVFLHNTTIAMIGAAGTFKSVAAIDIAASIATGVDWHGHTTRQGAVFFLAGEGNAGISRRLKAWEIVNGTLDGAPLYVSTGGIGLIDPINTAAVAEEVEKLALRHETSPSLVVIDTLARNFGAGDENSTSDMGQFIANLDRHIREPFGCTVLLVHHTGLADGGRARGSSALRAAVDTEILFERLDKAVTLRCTKSKDAPEFEPLAFETRTVELPWNGEDGIPETSFVLKPSALPVPKPSSRFGKHEDKAFATLERLYDDARERLLKSGHDPNKAMVTVTAWRDAFDGDRQRFFDAKRSLEKKKVIRFEPPHVFIIENIT